MSTAHETISPIFFIFFLSHRDFTSENYFGWWTICWLYIVLSVDFALLNVFHGLKAQFSFMLIAVIAQSSIMEPGMWNAGKADIYSHSNWIDFYLNGWPQIPPSAVISVQLPPSLSVCCCLFPRCWLSLFRTVQRFLALVCGRCCELIWTDWASPWLLEDWQAA